MFSKQIFKTKTLNRNNIYQHYHLDIFYPITQGQTLKSIDNEDYWVGLLHNLSSKASEFKTIGATRKLRELYAKDFQKFNYLIGVLEDADSKFIIELPTKKDILKDKLEDGKFHNGLKAEFKPLKSLKYMFSKQIFKTLKVLITKIFSAQINIFLPSYYTIGDTVEEQLKKKSLENPLNPF